MRLLIEGIVALSVAMLVAVTLLSAGLLLTTIQPSDLYLMAVSVCVFGVLAWAESYERSA